MIRTQPSRGRLESFRFRFSKQGGCRVGKEHKVERGGNRNGAWVDERYMPERCRIDNKRALGIEREKNKNGHHSSFDCLRCCRMTMSRTLAMIPAVVAVSVTDVQNA